MDSFLSSSKPTVTMQESFVFPPKVLYENRYCNQDDLSVIFCGGRNITARKPVKSVFKLHFPNFKCEKYTNMPEALNDCKTAVINSDLFVFGEFTENGEYDSCVQKFCNKTKTWSYKTQTDINFSNFIVCSFKQNIYVIRYDRSCFVYNFDTNKLIQVANMIECRRYSACTVFEETFCYWWKYN